MTRLDTARLADRIISVAGECTNETELRIKLKPVFDELLAFAGFEKEEINKIEQHEQRIVLKQKTGRIDTLYGNVIIEFKSPGTLDNATRLKEAVEQLTEYLEGYVEVHKISNRYRIVGVLTDGFHMLFIKWSHRKQKWEVSKPYPVTPQILAELIDIFRGLIRKPLQLSEIIKHFGQRSKVAKELIITFYTKLQHASERTLLLFEDWRRVFSYVAAYSPQAIKELGKFYGLKDANPELLFFAIHTYYALFMKLLSAELVSLFVSISPFSFLRSLQDSYRLGAFEKFKEELEKLENGHLFREVGIKNYLEGDYFGWYLNELDEELAKKIYDLVSGLAVYEPTVTDVDKKSIRDLFKSLYEDLVPKEIRHNLGEYYTDDWVAELLLDKIGWSVEEFEKLKKKTWDKTAPLKYVLIDPACGSGTFLTLAIQRLREYAEENYIHESELLNAILSNIVGFDLNPLATLAAKSNYLLAISDLLRHIGMREIELPIYMADSLLSEEERTILKEEETVPVYILETEAESFQIPVRVAKDRKLLSEILETIEQGIEWMVPKENFLKRIKSIRNGLSDSEIAIIAELYDKILELEKKNLNKIWTRIIRNAFSPLFFLDKADFIVGNPPWLSFRYVGSKKYQEKLKDWIKNKYKLTEKAELITHMELATLFFVRAADLYLKPKGRIGFVMPRSIFSADQHANFRDLNYEFEKTTNRGQIKQYLRFEYLIDMEKVSPLFNVPSCILLAKLDKKPTEYPISGLLIEGKLPRKNMLFSEAQEFLTIKKVKWFLYTIGERSYIDTYKPVDIEVSRIISRIKTRSPYYEKFFQGATIVPRVFWFVDILEEYPDKLLVTSSERAIRQAKNPWKNIKLEGVVEKRFIFNVYTSTELIPFGTLEPNTAILPIEPNNEKYRIIQKEDAYSNGYIGLAKWLGKCEELWNKLAVKYVSRGMSIYDRLNYQRGLTSQNPKTKYIVVYPTSATYLVGAVIENSHDKKVIIDTKLYYFSTQNKEEAFYLSAILNTSLLDQLIKPLQSKGSFGPRDIHKKPLEFYIPKFDETNPIHTELAKIAIDASKKVANLLPNLTKPYENRVITPQIIGKIRAQIKEELKDELERIDELVLELFKSVAQTKNGNSILDYIK